MKKLDHLNFEKICIMPVVKKEALFYEMQIIEIYIKKTILKLLISSPTQQVLSQ